MHTTIDWLTKQTNFQFNFIAGLNGNQNVITGVNIIDNPDTIRFLIGGELILSTGYFLREDPSLIESIIEDLYSKKCAGLVIAIKRYLDEIPSKMIEDANRLNFPIICVSFETNFSQISRLVYANILHNELSDADHLYKMFHRLNTNLAAEHSLNDTINTIEQIIGFPALLTNSKFELIAYSNGSHVISNELDLQLYPFETTTCLNYLDTYEKSQFEVITRHDRIIFSIRNESKLYGFICFLNADKGFNSIHYNFAYTLLPLLSLEISNDHIKKKLSRQGQNSFLKNMMSGQLSTLEIKDQCEIYGFSLDAERVCLVVQPDFLIDTTEKEKNEIFEKYNNIISRIKVPSPCAVYHFHDDNNVVILLLFSKTVPANITKTTLQYAQFLIDNSNTMNLSCQIGISEILCGISTLHSSYMEALQALRLGRKLHPEQAVFRYSVNMLSHLVSNLIPDSYIYESYIKLLRPLIDFDKQHSTELSTTLFAYLKNNGSIKDTAKSLFIHRNTMTARLEKIKELMEGFDLDCFDNRVILYIAFHIIHTKDM